jgi:hypothetical protein
VVDFNPLHEQADQFSALMPIHVCHSVVHATGKVLQPANDE